MGVTQYRRVCSWIYRECKKFENKLKIIENLLSIDRKNRVKITKKPRIFHTTAATTRKY